MAFKLPKTPLKYVLPGVMAFTEYPHGRFGCHDTLRLHPSNWILKAAEQQDAKLEDRLDDLWRNHRKGTSVHSQIEEVYQIVQYTGQLPHTYKPLYVYRTEVSSWLRTIISLHPEGSSIKESAQVMETRIAELPKEVYKDDPTLVNAYLDSNPYVDTNLPVRGGRSYETRVALQNLLTADVIGDEYDNYT